MTYQPTKEDLREEAFHKYLDDGGYWSIPVIRALLNYFNDQYLPTKKIRREMDRLGRVGLNRDRLTPRGYLVQILRKWDGRCRNKALVGHYVYPHLYWASYDQVDKAPVQLWRGVKLCWIPIAELTVVINDFLERKNDGHTKSSSQIEGTNNQQEPAGQLHPTPPATGGKVGTDSQIVKGESR